MQGLTGRRGGERLNFLVRRKIRDKVHGQEEMAKLVPTKTAQRGVVLPKARHYTKCEGRAYARDPLHTPNKKQS